MDANKSIKNISRNESNVGMAGQKAFKIAAVVAIVTRHYIPTSFVQHPTSYSADV